MNTYDLARKLNAVQTITLSNNQTRPVQPFDYILVLDFEATCWEKGDALKQPPEIIEFSVVFYDVNCNMILEEFQEYLKPTESPQLSEFCVSFTGITQAQVDKGIDLATCLGLFNKWLKELTQKYGVVFELDKKTAAFATWSDWDLKTCLRKECRRKGLTKAEYFSNWIDLRALYMGLYGRIPKGLIGALAEVGLSFVGKQHCGLHDARNTAFLAGRMINDGVTLQITSP